MKIALINFTPMRYDVRTPVDSPLGGSESALCYLSVELAKRGHEICLFADVKKKKKVDGVIHIPRGQMNKNELDGVEVVIVQNTLWRVKDIRKMLPRQAKMVFWTQHAANEVAVEGLKDKKIADLFDLMVMISYWQAEDYEKKFLLDRSKVVIIRNAIAPSFERLFGRGENIWKTKGDSLEMAYTSTPFRGLDVLIRMWPKIKNRFPEAKLSIFGGMETYQQDNRQFGEYYRMAKRLDGVRVLGAMGQGELADRLKKIKVLVYPNTFAETGCTSVMEAMAAGLVVVTSEFGALPETCMGFAQLVSLNSNFEGYSDDFVAKIDKAIKHQMIDDIVKRQVDFVNGNCVWLNRANEWEAWLYDLASRGEGKK